MDPQAGEETTTGIGTPPPHAGRSGDEPADNFVRGVLGASRPRDHHQYRSRSRLKYRRYGRGHVRDEADAGVSFHAGREDGGGPVRDRAEGSTSVYSQAQHEEEEEEEEDDQDDDDDMYYCPLPTTMGQAQAEEGGRAGMISRRTVPPSYGSGTGRPDNFVDGGAPGASRPPPGSWADHRSRNRQRRGYCDDVRHLPADEDGSMYPSSPTKMGSQQFEEETTRIIRSTPPPSCRSFGGGRPHNFVDGTVRRGASRPANRYWAHHRMRNELRNYMGYGGVADLYRDEGLPLQSDHHDRQDGSANMDPSHTNVDRQAEEGETSTGILMISNPPPHCRRSGGQPAADSFAGGASRRPWGIWDDHHRSRNRLDQGPCGGGVCDEAHEADVDHHFLQAGHEDGSVDDHMRKELDQQTDEEGTTRANMISSSSSPPPSLRSGSGQPDDFAGELLLIGSASRPRGRPRGGDYHRRSRNWRNEGFGGARDLPDEGTVRFRQAGGHDDHQDRRRPDTVQAPDGGVRHDQADHEGVFHSFPREEQHEDGSSADQADGAGACSFQDGRDEETPTVPPADGGLRVYDNIVVGDPSGVIFGRRNYAGGRVTGRVSGNRVIR